MTMCHVYNLAAWQNFWKCTQGVVCICPIMISYWYLSWIKHQTVSTPEKMLHVYQMRNLLICSALFRNNCFHCFTGQHSNWLCFERRNDQSLSHCRMVSLKTTENTVCFSRKWFKLFSLFLVLSRDNSIIILETFISFGERNITGWLLNAFQCLSARDKVFRGSFETEFRRCNNRQI